MLTTGRRLKSPLKRASSAPRFNDNFGWSVSKHECRQNCAISRASVAQRQSSCFVNSRSPVRIRALAPTHSHSFSPRLRAIGPGCDVAFRAMAQVGQTMSITRIVE